VEEGKILSQFFRISLAGHNRQHGTCGTQSHSRQEKGTGGRRHDKTAGQIWEKIGAPPINQGRERSGHSGESSRGRMR
jgi:hypothetical protein